MQTFNEAEQLSLFGQDSWHGRMSPAHFPAGRQKAKTSGSSSRRSSELVSIPFQSLDLTPGAGNLLGESYWELVSPWRGGSSTLNTGPAPRSAVDVYSLSQILQVEVPIKYYLSPKACLGILRRAFERGKELPPQLKYALQIQAGLPQTGHAPAMELKAYHINQRDEGIDLHGVSGALMATNNMQMQTFITGSSEPCAVTNDVIGFDGYNGELTGGVSSTLGTNCGMSTGRNGVMETIAFAANQRDEVRDLHDVAGALASQPGMKQQTFIATGALNPWDTQQKRVFTEDGVAPTLAGADGGGSRNPAGLLFAAGVVTKGNGDCFLSEGRHTALSSGGGQAGQGYPCVLTAGFCAGAAPTAGGIGWQEECSPTLKAGESGTNMVPSILCINDQGGQRMDITENQTSTLRAQMGGHQPLICLNDQGGSVMDCSVDVTGTLRAQEHGHQPLVFDVHGQDSRYTGPHDTAQTVTSAFGMGGGNTPLVSQKQAAFCIAGNIIERQPQNGGNGFGYQEELAYTLTATDHHAICTTTYQDVVGALCQGDEKGVGNQYVSQDKCIIAPANMIRRLTPLECERLQGFPDGWTDIPAASDSARYKALGNSVAIPCVEYIMQGVALVLKNVGACAS